MQEIVQVQLTLNSDIPLLADDHRPPLAPTGNPHISSQQRLHPSQSRELEQPARVEVHAGSGVRRLVREQDVGRGAVVVRVLEEGEHGPYGGVGAAASRQRTQGTQAEQGDGQAWPKQGHSEGQARTKDKVRNGGGGRKDRGGQGARCGEKKS